MPNRNRFQQCHPLAPHRYLVVVMLAIVAVTTGCGMFSNRQAVKVSMPDFERGKLINTAIFFPYESASQRAGGLDLKAFHQKIVGILQNECKGLNLLTADDPQVAALMMRLAAYLSAGDSIGFSETARAAGISAIVTGRIAEIAASERAWGFWWFSNNNYYLNMQVDTTIYDVETGAKTIDTSLTKEEKIDGLEYDAMTIGRGSDLSTAEPLLMDLAEDSAERACKALSNQPWIGFVTEVDKDTLTLVPGAASGLTAGMKLHVFGSGTLLEGSGGHRYFIPGLEKAAIDIVSVAPDRAQARVLTGSAVAVGDSVRLLD